MKYNTSTKSVYEVFGEENKRYVMLAIAALNKESKTIFILQKRYGPKYDGEGGVRFLNYSESEYLNSALRRIDSYVQGIKVLSEVYKETDEQILKRFQQQTDVQIINMLRNIASNNKAAVVTLLPTKNSILTKFNVTEKLLTNALDHVENMDHKRIYMYYYGIARSKMSMEVILKLFPDYNENKVKDVLLDVQSALPDYIKIEREKENSNSEDSILKKKNKRKSISKNTAYGSGFRYNSLFDYFFDKDDSLERKREKRDIILDYMESVDSEKRDVIKKIFGESYNSLTPNIELTKAEKSIFNDLRVKVRKYIEHILSIRYEHKGKMHANDRVILTKDNGFKEKLNDYFEKKTYPLAMNIFAHYIESHDEIKSFLNKFYNLDTMDLRADMYSSKNDAKRLKAIVKDINDYIKACSLISKSYKGALVNYFKKPYMSDARVQLIYGIVLEVVNTLSQEEKQALAKLYGEDYNLLNIYVDITSREADIINQAIEKIDRYVGHSLETINTYKASIFTYFHKAGMSVSYKEKLDAEISRFIDASSSKGKYVAVMLYGKTYAKLNPSVSLSRVQVNLFNSLLNEIDAHIKLVEGSLKKERRKAIPMKSACFLDFFTDPSLSEEENNAIIEEVRKTVDSCKYRDVLLKFYDNNYNLKSNVEMTKEDKVEIRYIRKQIFIKVFGPALPKSISDMAINGHTNEDIKIRIIKETDKYLEGLDSSVKKVLMKVYGADLHTFNSEAKLTNYELYIINKFNHELNAHIKEVLPFAKKIQKPREERGKLPKNFFSFLESVETDMTLEELTKDALDFINNSKSKYVFAVKKLYGEELLELNESIIPTEEDITSVRFLIRDMRARYRLQKKNGYSKGKRKSNKKTVATIQFPSNILDNFNINYNENNKNMIINRIGFNTSIKESFFSRILHEVYGDNLMDYKTSSLQIEVNELSLFKSSVKVVNNQFSKDMSDCNLKDDLLDYFSQDKLNREQLIEEISKRLEDLDNPQALRFKRLISFMYDDNFKLVRPMLLKTSELETIEKVINSLNRSKKEKTVEKKRKYNKITMHLNFFDYFLFDGETEVPESRKSTILKIVRGSKSAAASLSLDLFGNNLDQECRDPEELKANKIIFNSLVRSIIKRLNKTYSRNLFMLADNFIDQFYIDTDSEEMKEVIKYYVVHYLESSHSKCMSVVKSAYDENYNLRKEYIFNGNRSSYSIFIHYIKSSVERYRNKILGGAVREKPQKVEEEQVVEEMSKLNMMDLGKKGYLALTNDLFDIKLVGNEEIEKISEELTDEVIKSAYNELMDSKTIMDLLMISEDTLIEFYLRHIDDLENPREAFNYLINIGNRDIIKRLMVSPLFLRVVNYISDTEREIIYLKLVQVTNKSLTDELISKITKVDINSIREYQIMTREDKVNALNEFIIKRK